LGLGLNPDPNPKPKNIYTQTQKFFWVKRLTGTKNIETFHKTDFANNY